MPQTRDYILQVRLTETEREELVVYAEAVDLTLSSSARSLMLAALRSGSPAPPASPHPNPRGPRSQTPYPSTPTPTLVHPNIDVPTAMGGSPPPTKRNVTPQPKKAR